MIRDSCSLHSYRPFLPVHNKHSHPSCQAADLAPFHYSSSPFLQVVDELFSYWTLEDSEDTLEQLEEVLIVRFPFTRTCKSTRTQCVLLSVHQSCLHRYALPASLI